MDADPAGCARFVDGDWKRGIRRSAVMLAALVALGAAGCSDDGRGAVFELDSRVFVFNYRVATATYLVNIAPDKPTTEPRVVVTSFEDPAGGDAIVVRKEIQPGYVMTTIYSPPVRCIRKDRPYRISIRVETAQGAILQQLDTTLVSSQDQTDLPEQALVDGPLYRPNPNAGKMDESRADCPSS